MIQQQTKLKVSDNSGAKIVKCIKVLGGFKKKFSCIGETVVVSVMELRNKSKITSKVIKGSVHKALIVRTKKSRKTKDGSYFFFNDNAVCLINKQNNPVGTRVIGPTPKFLKKGKFSKFSNISAGTV